MKREDRDFDNIIEGMSGTPAPMIPPPPPPTPGERVLAGLKIMLASVIVFVAQSALAGWAIMSIHRIVVYQYDFSVAGIGFWPATGIAVFGLVLLAIAKMATR